jgi:putative oxidoreductase
MSSGLIGSDAPSSHPLLSCTDRLAGAWQDFLLLVGRVLIGTFYILSGWRKMQDIPTFAQTMPRRGLPEFLGYIAPPVEFVAGIAIILGFATRYAALALLIYIVTASLTTYRYWTTADPNLYTAQNIQFWKNVTVAGGLVFLFVTAGGRWSLDALLRRRS